jgi:hypothetical protein
VFPDKDYNYETKRLRRIKKEKDGYFHFGDKVFSKLTGTREEVWNDLAYKTTGDLIKEDLTIGTVGNIVSLSKRQTSLKDNHLTPYNLKKKSNMATSTTA